MPDLPNRLQREQQLATALNAAWAPWRVRMADDPAATNWKQLEDETKAALIFVMALTYFDAAGGIYRKFHLAADDAAWKQRAETWAAVRADQVARDITQHTRQRVEAAIEAGQARWAVETLDANRIGSIVVTETTTAISQAERAAAQEVAVEKTVQVSDEGPPGELSVPLTARAYWQTELDGLVCRVCRPLHNRPEEEWRDQFLSGPPAHPRCRCWLDWKLKSYSKVIQTTR